MCWCCQWDELVNSLSEKHEKAVTVYFKTNTPLKVGTRGRAVSTERSRQVRLSRNLRILGISRFVNILQHLSRNFPAIFSGNPRTDQRCRSCLGLRTLFPLTAFKNAPKPQFVQNFSQRLFWGFQTGGLKFVKICPKITIFSTFDQFLTNFSPHDWNPQKQSLGQILDKFGVRGVFECCQGKEGLQGLETHVSTLTEVLLLWAPGLSWLGVRQTGL